MTMMTPPPEATTEGALSPLQGYCLNCGRPFTYKRLVPPLKKFCGQVCTNQWHYQHNTRPRRERARVASSG